MSTLAPIPIATTTALLRRLQARAEREGRSWPLNERLTAKLAKPLAPAAAWLKLAHALHQEWLKPAHDPEAGLLDDFIECVVLAWEDLDDAARLHSGLYPPLIRALSARGEVDVLAALVPRVATAAASPGIAAAEAGPVVALMLRQLRQQQQWPALAQLVASLHSAWQPGAAWGAPLLAAVLALAREATAIAPLRDAAQWLPALTAQAEADPALTEETTWRELGRLALRTLHIDAMQRVAGALLARESRTPDSQSLLLQLLVLLAGSAPDARTRDLLDQAAHRWPRHPQVQWSRARIAHREGAELDSLTQMLQDIDPAEPGWAQAVGWWAGVLFHGGDEAHALALYTQLHARDSLSPADRLRMGHLTARTLPPSPGSPASAREAQTQEVPETPEAPEAPEPAWSAEQLGPLAPALEALSALLSEAPRHDSAADPAALEARGEQALVQCARALPGLADVGIRQCVQVVRHLHQVASAAFGAHSQWPAAFPFAFTPAYGRIDPARCAALMRVLHRHVVTIADFALERDHPLQGGPGQASLRHVVDLAAWRCESHWALGAPQEARDAVIALRERLGPLGALPLRELHARTLLDTGERDGVAPLLTEPVDVLPLADWDDWLQAEGLHPQTLVDDGALAGHFETVGPDAGTVRRHAHALAPTRFTVVHHRQLGVRMGHGLIGPHAGLLRPGAWHLSMGDYPYEHRAVALRGSARALAAALRPARWRAVADPVVVLANMDATYHRNYYHWTVLIAARIEALRARGLLVGGRRLLLPRELSGWMRASLAALGIGEDMVLPYGEDEDLMLSDALLASPLDHASPSLLEGLRQAMWRHADLDPAAPPAPDRLLYISRRGEGRRPLVEEDALQQRAAALGFEVVAPETLTLAEQVRLFAQARGIAGPPGAAYTNLIWAGPGTRVLSIFKEEATLPTFVDLSLMRGQTHRWLLGRNLPGYDLMSTVNAPYSVDLALAESALAWAAGAA